MSADAGADAGGSSDAPESTGSGETGRLVGTTAAHNTARASIDGGASGAVPPVSWSTDLASIAQAYADQLAASCSLTHSSSGYGENIAYFGGTSATPAEVVAGWTSEQSCWSYGGFMTTDSCDTGAPSCPSGCGHFTQVVWRDTQQIGCGVAVCAGSFHQEIWVCNYDPAGNYVGELPY